MFELLIAHMLFYASLSFSSVKESNTLELFDFFTGKNKVAPMNFSIDMNFRNEEKIS